MVGVSVIIPVYNTEKYIVDCIESVLANEFKDFEIVCVDDGSVDSSLSLMQKLEQEHSCIKVVSQENKGQSAARNKALQIATGKYVYFLDSDDKISNNTLGNLYNYLEADNLDVLYFSGDSFYDSPELEEEFDNLAEAYMRSGDYEGWTDGLSLVQQLRDKKDYSVSPCIQIIRRQFLIDNDISFYEGIIHEDNLFSFLVYFHARRAKCVNDIYFHRRVRESSVMTTEKTYKNLLGYYTCFLKEMDYVGSHSFDDEHQNVLNGILRALKMNVRRHYLAIDTDEREKFYESITVGEKMFFNCIILHELETEIKMRKQINKKSKKIKELKKIEASTSYKVGKFITWPMRKCKNILKKIWRKIHG